MSGMLVACCLELRYEYMTTILVQFCDFMAQVHFLSQGLRAFLPKPEMMTRPRNFMDLKNKVSYASCPSYIVSLYGFCAVL